MKIHPIVLYMAIKDVLAVAVLLYFLGSTAALWWVGVATWFYSILVLNSIIKLERIGARTDRTEPHFDEF
jgi:hypothetical protein